MKTVNGDFLVSVREALKNYNDPLWLGENSNLATPYFLGPYLQAVEQPYTAAGRGEALQRVLYAAAKTLWRSELPQSRQGLWDAVERERHEIGNGGPRYFFLILDLRFYRKYYAPRTPPTVIGAMYDFLNVSASAFYRHIDQAVDEVVAALLRLIRPSLRLERPVMKQTLVGRDKVLQETLAALRKQEAVAFSGVGGIGKSSLGSAVLAAWDEGPSFWYTFRPGINDEINSLLFNLGHFLQQSGRSDLWLHLVASEGNIASVELALGLLREDFERTVSGPMLLCFDEVDLLQTGSAQPRHGIHKQILELLEGLCQITPVLLIGQRALIDTRFHFALSPLTAEDISALAQNAGSALTQVQARKVHEASGGNPRLVELILAVDIDDTDTILMPRRQPAIQPLFNRLWKRVSDDEKQVLTTLSVFRTYAPRSVWGDRPGLLDLSRRQLIKEDAYGGITLLPVFRRLIYEELSKAQRDECHRQAAHVRSRLAQYTAAAYHLSQAEEFEAAIQLWSSVQDSEIAQGNADAAYMIFNQISTKAVKGRSCRQLRVIQNRLALLSGQLEEVLEGMDDYSWHMDDDLSVTALGQWGDAERLLGDLDAARDHYNDAIDMLGRMSSQIVSFQVKKGQAWLLESDHVMAEREANLAQYEIESFRGRLEINRGQHRQAQEYLKKALILARSLEIEELEARANYYLAIAAGNLGDIPSAHAYAEDAMAYYDSVGDRLKVEGLRAEMAGIYLNVGRFEEVIEPAERALAYFERIKHSHWQANISSNLAEAYFETGDLEKAQQYALRAIATENPFIQPYALYTLGQVYRAKGGINAADQSFKVGLQWAERNDDSFICAYLHKVYGSFLLDIGDFEEGLNHLQTALKIFSRLGIPYEEENTRQILALS